MHNKFFIIDAKSTNDAWVITGSANDMDKCFNDNPNNGVFIQDNALAKAYTLEFEEMWGGIGNFPDTSNAKFGAQKTDNTPHKFIVGNKMIELYFNPTDSTNTAIAEAIYTANHDFEFALMLFWGHQLGIAVDNVYDGGVIVRGIIDSYYTKFTSCEYHYLHNKGVNILEHTLPEALHHKYAIIDANDPDSDPMVITGSYNWHYSSVKIDENTLIIHDRTIANIFLQEFSARFNELHINQ